MTASFISLSLPLDTAATMHPMPVIRNSLISSTIYRNNLGTQLLQKPWQVLICVKFRGFIHTNVESVISTLLLPSHHFCEKCKILIIFFPFPANKVCYKQQAKHKRYIPEVALKIILCLPAAIHPLFH